MSTEAIAIKDVAGEIDGYVTARLSNHWFALPIASVHEVFLLSRITKVPLAPPGLIGALNLRGRIVTALDTRQILGFDRAEKSPTIALGVEKGSELFGLAVDEMGDVMTSSSADRETAPSNLDKRWRDVVTAVQRHDDQLVLIVDVDRLLEDIGSLVAG